MLTLHHPFKCQVHGSNHEDFYVTYRDPIGVRHLCEAGTDSVLGIELRPLESVKIKLSAEIVGDK